MKNFPWVGLDLQAKMIKWANSPEPVEFDEHDEPADGLLSEMGRYWPPRRGLCKVPTAEGPACDFPLDSRGRCGVESRHTDRA